MCEAVQDPGASLALVELSDQLQQPVRGCVDVGGEIGDFGLELVQIAGRYDGQINGWIGYRETPDKYCFSIQYSVWKYN